MDILDLVRYLFSLVGLLFLGRWVFQRNWRMWQKAGALLLMVGLANAIFNGLRAGMSTAHNQMTILDVLATIGIVLVGTWALARPQVRRDWRAQTAIVGIALVVLWFMWVPRFNATPTGSLTATPSAPPVSVPSAPATSGPGRWVGTPASARSRTSTAPACPPDISYELKQRLGCP